MSIITCRLSQIMIKKERIIIVTRAPKRAVLMDGLKGPISYIHM